MHDQYLEFVAEDGQNGQKNIEAALNELARKLPVMCILYTLKIRAQNRFFSPQLATTTVC